MEKITARLVESLRTLGLTEYEARVYSALVAMGHADAKQIYEYLGASKPNVYESLKSLAARGFVLTIAAKPALYKAAPYELVLRRLIDAHRAAEVSAREELKLLEQSLGQADAVPALWTLFGDRNIENKLEELLSGASVSVRGIVPEAGYPGLEYLRGRDLPIDLIVRGTGDPAALFDLPAARVRNISKTGTLRELSDPEFAEFHGMLSEDVAFFIADDREFVYVLPAGGGPRTGITSANPSMLRMAALIFRFAWGKSGQGQD